MDNLQVAFLDKEIAHLHLLGLGEKVMISPLAWS
jgi:hypothetical protein